MPEKMLFNVSGDHSVKASKIREFGIYNPRYVDGTAAWEVKGWFNSNESFYFGSFTTEAEAKKFLLKLHRQIESK